MNAARCLDPDVPSHRTPLWLTADERADLTSRIEHFLSIVRVFPHVDTHLRAVLLELEVTSARDRLWPASAATARTAAGYTPDTIAVRVSADERAALTVVPDLPGAVTAALAGRQVG
jgi:hypothetical protein